MPKTINGLWETVVSYENLHAAWLAARKGKRYSLESLEFSGRAEERLIELQNRLIWGEWAPGKAREFWVRDPKWRAITAPPFADRVVHHALVRVIEPLFERRFISDSYACRSGKGAHAAVRAMQAQMRRAKRNWGADIYIVKCDIKSYFASIHHDVLMRAIGRAIADNSVIDLWARILPGYGFGDGVGLPVGSLTSQLAANIVLDQLDHRVKDDWGLPYYVRYMDDFVLLARDKPHARLLLDLIADTVASLGLRLNPKSGYWPWQRGADFCGYRVWPTHMLPRKRTVKRARRALSAIAKRYGDGRADLADVRDRLMNFLAYARTCSCLETTERMLSELVLKRKGKENAVA